MPSFHEADRIVEVTNGRCVEAEMLRIRAKSLTTAGNQVTAEESPRTAIAAARSQSAKLWELHARTSLARLGNPIEARNLLAPIYSWYNEGFDAPDLKDAKLRSTNWSNAAHLGGEGCRNIVRHAARI